MGRNIIKKIVMLLLLTTTTTYAIMYTAQHNNILGEETKTEFNMFQTNYLSNNFTFLGTFSNLTTKSVDKNSQGGATRIIQTVRENFDNETTLAVGLANSVTVVKPLHLSLGLNDCLNRSVKHRVSGTEGNISIHFDSQEEAIRGLCKVELRVPQGMVAHVHLKDKKSSCFAVVLRLYDESNKLMFEDCPLLFAEEFFTYSSTLSISVEMLNLYSPLDLRIYFTASPERDRPRLHVNYTSPTTGYIEVWSVQYNGRRIPFIKNSVDLDVPQGYLAAINFHSYETGSLCSPRDRVTLRSQNISTDYWPCRQHRNTFTVITLYQSRVHVEYKNYGMYIVTDFRILFSFHRVSALPVKLDDGRWNCSAVYWPDMQQHFPCNFRTECVGGEDEAGCWQNEGTCGPGTFLVDGRCFMALPAYKEIFSWNSAREWCIQHGGDLASLSTRRVWNRVVELFSLLDRYTTVYIGAKRSLFDGSSLYRHSMFWTDGTVVHFMNVRSEVSRKTTDTCLRFDMGIYALKYEMHYLFTTECEVPSTISHHLCQMSGAGTNPQPPEISITTPSSTLSKGNYIRCPLNHFTHNCMACDGDCWVGQDGDTSLCLAPLTSLPQLFKCVDVQQSVPYTLVCDHRADCRDGSDEGFCYFPPCNIRSPFRCDGKRCVQQWERCNGQVDCDDQADENVCTSDQESLQETLQRQLPVSIDLDTRGEWQVNSINLPQETLMTTFRCPETHFVCSSLQQVCLPVYMRCNKMYDCPGHEDEAACDRYTCPGFYRCRGSQVCVHESHVCDGVYHCPQRDDEILCNVTCPHNCVCHGWAFICSGYFQAVDYVNLRYLDASGSLMTIDDLHEQIFLVHLILVRCNLTTLHDVRLPNLRTLDVSSNELTNLASSHFVGLTNLEFLKISNNPLQNFSFDVFIHPSAIKSIDLSEIPISEIDFSIFTFLSELKSLNLSGSHISHVTGQGFPGMKNLRILDLRKCPIATFPRKIFHALEKLETVFTDNYKLCCPATLPPGFNVLNCHAPSDEVSSCDDLLRSNLYRVGLVIFASLSLLGNVSTLVYRLIFHKTSGNVGYDVFVTNLCVADFLMGVYLLIIGIADYRYKGVYLWEDIGWRNSSLCKVAGFVCLLSCEVSVFIIILITLDRLLVVRFPLSHFHFGTRSAQVTCSLSWLAGLSLAAIPLAPMTSHWQFFSQTSICIPLPTSRMYFPGRMYSYGVIVFLNFVFFVLIFIGQICIYWSVRVNSMSAAHSSKTIKDFNIARRLITVAMSDFVCWFPVGLAGILASYDVPIPGEVNVGVAIFVLPLNAALNPYLYTINIYLERRRRMREEGRRKRVIAQLNLANSATSAGNARAKISRYDAVSIVKTLFSSKLLSLDDLAVVVQET